MTTASRGLAAVGRAGGPAPQFDQRGRLVAVVVVFVLAAGALGLRLLDLQLFDQARYVSWGKDQRLQTEPVVGERGRLFDRNGEALAVSLPQPFIAADPGLVGDLDSAAATLAPILGRSFDDVREALVSPGRFVYLQRPADDELAADVQELGLPFLIVRDEPRRFHPNGGRLARGLLGSVGIDNQGVSGLELQYDDLLAGTPGQLVLERSIDGRTIPDSVRVALPAIEGADMHLTIERALQFEVERALTSHVSATGSIAGVVIIADPATGDVLAMASVTDTEEAGIVTTSDNRAVTWTYEPASVMKAVTFSAVLNEGLAGPQTQRLVESEIQIYEDTFSDDSRYEPQVMSVAQILERSSNTGTISWAAELGDDILHHYMVEFGFGSTTELAFPGEASGILEEVGDWSGTSFATIAIGQGVAVTPLQMLAAYNVLANDGVYVSPRLVAGTSAPGGDLKSTDPSPARRVVDSEVARQISAMLATVVESGTATAAGVPGYRVAAKTGTARKVQDGGGYEDAYGAYHYASTVAGFFPADEPRFSMIVVLDEPDEIYASRTAAPLFGQLAAWTLRHFQVSPGATVVVDNPVVSLLAAEDAAPEGALSDAAPTEGAATSDAGLGAGDDGEDGEAGAAG